MFFYFYWWNVTTGRNVNKDMSSQLADEMKFAHTEAAINFSWDPVWAIRSIQQNKCKHWKFANAQRQYKAKIAILARLKASSDIKRDRSRRLNVERNITMLKTGRFRSRARQPKSFTYIKFHSATTRHKEKKLRRFLEEKLDAFLSIGNHAKPPKERTRSPLRCLAYRKESECVYNLTCLMVSTNPCSVRSLMRVPL